MKRAIYREQGGRFYRIKEHHILEIDYQPQYGVIGLNYGDRHKCLIEPNEHAKLIRKADFDKLYNLAMAKIKLAMK